jgi:hypothetical protein
MKARLASVGAALVLACVGAASDVRAQDVGEVVVTAERRAPPVLSGFTPPPHVVVVHRADNLIVAVQVDCDTRDQKDRVAEMKATLQNMISAAAASGGQIELGVESDNIVVPLKPESLDALLRPGDRDDTTTTTIVVKTHVTADDTIDKATARITGYIDHTRLVGRTQVTNSGAFQLTLITPRQYRPQVVAAIADDASQTLKAFGPGYALNITGLEHSVEWVRAGPLDLGLYIPYTLSIAPPGR